MMKNPTPRMIALLTALLAAVLTTGINLLFAWSPLDNYVPVMVASVVIVFAGVYMASWLLLSKFMFRKISPIYKTITRLRNREEELKEELEKRDLAEEINREVEDWASGQSEEMDQLREMEQYRKEFLGNVSHELKTPIFNVQGYVLTLLDGALEDPSVNRKYLERAEKSINRLINIVGDLDIISRLDSGEVKIEFENFDMVQLVREVFELQDMRAQKAGITLKFKTEPNGPVPVHADRDRIQEVMVNLIVNSIKYGSEKGCTSVELSDMEDRIMVEVSDNGLGIPNDDLPRIFERFYRVDKSRSRNQGGTGLGLAIVKHVIEAHNQTLNVRSKEGEGTVFNFTLMKGR